MFATHINERTRQLWLKESLAKLPAGWRILDAGAGELKNKSHCSHLHYVSQDFCEYKGSENDFCGEGLQNPKWNTGNIDIVGDIADITVEDESFDAILCSEVLEHVPDPVTACKEFYRLLRPGGCLILTAPFSSLTHMAPYFFCTGFSKYWYSHHLENIGFQIDELTPNGDWFEFLKQEISRLGTLERNQKNWSWPLSYLLILIAMAYFRIRGKKRNSDLACFGWHCIARK